MTDRYNTVTVVLEKETREDDAEDILNAIRCIRGVLKVKGDVADPLDFMAESRVRSEISKKIFDALKN